MNVGNSMDIKEDEWEEDGKGSDKEHLTMPGTNQPWSGCDMQFELE